MALNNQLLEQKVDIVSVTYVEKNSTTVQPSLLITAARTHHFPAKIAQKYSAIH